VVVVLLLLLPARSGLVRSSTPSSLAAAALPAWTAARWSAAAAAADASVAASGCCAVRLPHCCSLPSSSLCSTSGSISCTQTGGRVGNMMGDICLLQQVLAATAASAGRWAPPPLPPPAAALLSPPPPSAHACTPWSRAPLCAGAAASSSPSAELLRRGWNTILGAPACGSGAACAPAAKPCPVSLKSNRLCCWEGKVQVMMSIVQWGGWLGDS